MDAPWWYDLTGYANILTAVGILVVGWWTHQSRSQVKNSHGTNLRDDMDIIRDSVKSVGHQIGEVRDELGRIDHRQIMTDDRVRKEMEDLRARQETDTEDIRNGFNRLSMSIDDIRFWQEQTADERKGR